MATNSTISSVLKDVVAYVDVWSSDKTANYSKPFVQQLQEMGAQVTKTFTKQVTHVIFSHGHPATWRRAKKSHVKLVSVLWVGRCYDEAMQVNEDSFPALNETNPVLKNKKHRCMQPKDSPERTPDNDKRIRRKLDKMIKDLPPIEPLVSDVSPIIIDEENGIIYSPAFKRSDYMAQRLKDMKEKHENISLTASQMVEKPSGLEPSLGNSPTVFSHSYGQSDDDSILSVAETGSAAVSPAKEEGTSLPNIKDHRHESLRTETTQPWMSPCSQVQSVNVHISPVKYPNFEENEDEEEKKRQKSSRRASRRVSVKKNSTESPKCILSDSKKSGKKVSRRSTIKSPSPASKELKTLSSESISKKGQELTKRNKSFTETKIPENVKCTVTTSAAATNLSIKTTSPKEHTESKLTPIFSALVRLPTVPCESRKTVPCSTDGDDDVFEDYFSPAYLRQKPKKASFSGLSAKTFQLPFELDSDSKKRKPRSESAVNETSTGKKKKLEQSTLHLKDLDTEDASERLSHKEGNKLLSDLASSSDNLKQLTKKKRQSALQFTSICAAQTTRDKQLPLSARKTKSEESPATLELHKKPDRSLKSSVTIKGNEDPVASGLTQTEEQTEEKGITLQTMVHSTKVGRTLVMTSMPTEKQGTVVQVVKALGGFTLVDEVCESTTHVVSGSHRRTLNILLGIARGCWILSFEWILWSLEKRQWIPEEPYELSDQFPAAQICRLQRHLSAGEHQQDLFQDQPVMFVSQLSRPPPQSLIELIQLCGGTVCRTVRQAGLCIGRYSGRTPEGSRVLSEQWVLDSITHLKVLPYDDYTLD
ncbi:microcephalin [Periophthalmus magnuspinnatus]|uniref:microcephalin n=1 Tax=Periophthalmus magnuspinnatus TaxID=409849 RepID=UPI0024366CF3|nr:microcephalin [Periophthalmus magnuspinnatus]XP_055083416.1 microcephalin [Periophthalmus magnuspinnatus]